MHDRSQGARVLCRRGLAVAYLMEGRLLMAVNDLPREMAALQPRLLRLATSLVHDEMEAEDLVQETYARALSAQHSFMPGTNLRAWLSTILRNLYISGRRRAALHPQVALDEAGARQLPSARPAHDVERVVIARADLTQVAEAFRSLPPIFAIPLRLVVLEELSYAEVARRLDIPVGSVMSRVYRGRRLLAQRLMERRMTGPSCG